MAVSAMLRPMEGAFLDRRMVNARLPRVAPPLVELATGQPWADIRNPFGVTPVGWPSRPTRETVATFRGSYGQVPSDLERLAK
jgi:hypothetical protein